MRFALSEPSRWSRVRLPAVDRGEVDGTEPGPGLARSTSTHRTASPRETGVVFVRAEGRTRMVRLRRDDPEAWFPGLIDTVLDGSQKAAAATEDA